MLLVTDSDIPIPMSSDNATCFRFSALLILSYNTSNLTLKQLHYCTFHNSIVIITTLPVSLSSLHRCVKASGLYDLPFKELLGTLRLRRRCRAFRGSIGVTTTLPILIQITPSKLDHLTWG